MKKVFSKEKYIERMGMKAYRTAHKWVDEADGREVDERHRAAGTVYIVCDEWCIEVDEKEKKTKMTIQDFKEKQIAVVIKTKPDLDMFLNMCDKAHMKWASGHGALEFNPKMKTKCIISYEGALVFDSDAMFGTDEEFYKKHGYTVVGISEFFADTEKPRKEYKIVITCTDGKTTKAQMYVNGKTVKGSEAHCNPEDDFRFSTGAKWAFERLFEKK